MLQKYNRYKILQEFFNFPRRNFHIRELSRITKITQPSMINHLNELVKENLILKEKKGLYPTFRANRENELFKVYKKTNIIIQISQSGLLNYVYDSCLPTAIILFGSASKGEDTEESDIDLFIQASDKKLKLEKYEKILNRKINLFFKENFSKLSSELKNNILNGIMLRGYIKVF